MSTSNCPRCGQLIADRFPVHTCVAPAETVPVEEEPWNVRLTEDDPAGYVARWDDLTAEDAELIFTSCKMSALGFSLFLLHGSQVVRKKGRYRP